MSNSPNRPSRHRDITNDVRCFKNNIDSFVELTDNYVNKKHPLDIE